MTAAPSQFVFCAQQVVWTPFLYSQKEILSGSLQPNVENLLFQNLLSVGYKLLEKSHGCHLLLHLHGRHDVYRQ